MNRREFVRNSIAATIAARAQAKMPASAPARKMNVLYVFSDQHREAAMPGKPFSPVEAPNLDKFRRENFTMENCISNFPLCSPHRGILMTGRWPQQTGVTGNGRKLAPDEHALGNTFRSAGYRTGYVGKWHLDGNSENSFIPKGPERQGFEDWHVWASTNSHYGAWTFDPETGAKIQPAGWNATLMTDDALTFLHKQTSDKPWFLMVSWNPPHPPFDPPEDDAAPYPQPDLKLRPNIDLEKPRWPQLASVDKLRDAERGYYGGITGVDKEFARLLAALEQTGEAENTIVVYTSDHGEMMGSHGFMSKIVPFEESCHVPFFIRVPGMTKQGSSCKDLFSSIDIFPTLCGLAGIPIPEHCAGRDFSKAMTAGKAISAGAVILMADSGAASSAENDIPAYRGIRTGTHTYAVMEDGRWILYDNVGDPFQQKNLAGDPAHAALMQQLDDRIAAWQHSVGDTFDLKKAIQRVSAYPS
jgi:arylsulfatase A-like enzyme